MELFFVNDSHRKNYESLEKNNQTKFEISYQLK